MLITLEEMRKLHAIQLEMLRELMRVMKKLNVRYYFVHGSLLSAVTTHKFIEEDDDIDIAVFREDYERLLKRGNDIVDSKYFLQCSQNDDFPLGFAKFRNKETEFYQPVLERYACHKGIYIDVFPIDFVPEFETRTSRTKRLLLNIRINSRLKVDRGWKQRCLSVLSMLIYPSYNAAVKKREALYAACPASKYVSIFGGKASEQRMPCSWFGEGYMDEFCKIEVNCPSDYDAYLTRIYGQNYWDKNPAEDRISPDQKIDVSASYIDFGDGYILGNKDV